MPILRCVLDTNILQEANATLERQPKARRKFVRRLELLQQIADRRLIVLISQQLLTEYASRISEPRNEYIRAFFEVLARADGAMVNWHSPWTGDAERARRCRFPKHDDHVLRTAIIGGGSTIYTEEEPMLKTDACIHRRFDVHIEDL